MTTLLTAALWYTISDSPGNDDTEISLQASVPPADAAAPVTGNRQYIVEFAPTFEGGGIHMCAWQWHFLLLPTPSSSLANTNTCVIYNVICSHFVTLYNLYVVSLTQQVVKEIDEGNILVIMRILMVRRANSADGRGHVVTAEDVDGCAAKPYCHRIRIGISRTWITKQRSRLTDIEEFIRSKVWWRMVHLFIPSYPFPSMKRNKETSPTKPLTQVYQIHITFYFNPLVKWVNLLKLQARWLFWFKFCTKIILASAERSSYLA